MSRVTLQFHGAAGTVTGSCFEINGAGKTLLIDCGIFQGTRSLEWLNHDELPFDPKSIDAVILTHAHLNHSGRLPYLYASGCKAETYCTQPTADILKPLLQDSAKLQAADVERRNRRADRAGLPRFTPLYRGKDITKLHNSIRTLEYCQKVDLGDGVSLRLWDSRHMVGSASVEINIAGLRLLVSGDIGSGSPMHCPGADLGGYDHVICESTHGDRDREEVRISDRREALARHVEETMAAAGNILIPACAVERTQTVLEDLDALFESKRLAPFNVYLDSPLAENITAAVLRHRNTGADLFDRENMRVTQSIAESKRLNGMTGIVIIAGSSMCDRGRIRHHLVRNLSRGNSRVLLPGFQVAGTLGSVLRDGARRVRISGNDVIVNAKIASLDGYSNHADRSNLAGWVTQRTPITGSIFLVHGESGSLASLSEKLREIETLPAAIIPALGEMWELHPGAPAIRLLSARPDAAELTASRDWRSKLAALREEVDDKINTLPTDEERTKMLGALERALETVG